MIWLSDTKCCHLAIHYVLPKFLPGPNLHFRFMKNCIHTSLLGSLVNHYFYKKLSFYTHIPNIYLGLGFALNLDCNELGILPSCIRSPWRVAMKGSSINSLKTASLSASLQNQPKDSSSRQTTLPDFLVRNKTSLVVWSEKINSFKLQWNRTWQDQTEIIKGKYLLLQSKFKFKSQSQINIWDLSIKA